MSGDTVLGRISRPAWGIITERLEKLCNEKLQNVYTLVLKSSRIRWTRRVAHMRAIRNATFWSKNLKLSGILSGLV
jgi:hypothetical protein